LENEGVVSKVVGEQEEERVCLLRVETWWQVLIRKKWQLFGILGLAPSYFLWAVLLVGHCPWNG
jgi:hypothetical protein